MIGDRLRHKPHPAIAELIAEERTPFSDLCVSPFLFSLANEEFERVYNHLKEKEPLLFRNPEFDLLIERYKQMRDQILSRESNHTEELISLAIKAISEIYDIPEDQIKWNVNFNLEGLIDPSFVQDIDDLDIDEERLPYLQEQIEKRILLNSLVHGSSMHIWKSLHYIVSTELKKLSPILPVLYDVYTAVLGYSIWLSVPDGLQLAVDEGTLISQGINQITFDEDDDPQISVEAINFPAMLHEVNKGALDLIICHGIPEDVTEDELKYIYAIADKYSDEYWHYIISPSIWNRLLKYAKVRTKDLPDVLMELSLLDFTELKSVFTAICRDTDYAHEILIQNNVISRT